MKESNTCVLIMSCDNYSDLWYPFFYFFKKYWPDCPFPIFLATNTKKFNNENVITLNSNKFTTWSDETAAILKQIPFQTILYLQDDYLLQKGVSNSVVLDLIEKMRRFNVDYLRLFPSPGPDLPFPMDAELGEISEHAKYRTSLQAAIWKKDVFLDLLRTEENQWEFELNSPERSRNYFFLSVKKLRGNIQNHTYPITYYYLTGVIRGKWRWAAAQICSKEGIWLDPNVRKIETYFTYLANQLYDKLPLFIKKVIDYVKSKFN